MANRVPNTVMNTKNPSSSTWFIARIARCAPVGSFSTSTSIAGCRRYFTQAAEPKNTTQANPRVATSLAQAAGWAVM